MTKRILSILVAALMVMALIPMSVFASAEASRSGNASQFGKIQAVANKDAAIAFDFEADAEPTDWTFVDSDGDGYNWDWQGDYSESPHMTAYEGEGLIFSASYDNDAGTPLTPDNWAITPAIALPDDAAAFCFYVAGQDSSYAAEHYAVYAGTSLEISEMTEIQAEAIATGEYTQQIIDISAYAGQTVYFAIRHFNITDMFFLNIDLVEVYTEGDAPEPTPEPTPRPLPEGCVYGNYFETDEELSDWMIYDADGDGYNWRLNTNGSYVYEGEQDLVSYSYYSGALSPDNWLIADGIVVPDQNASATFYALNYSSYYPDTIAAFVIVPAEEGTLTVDDLENAEMVLPDFQPATTWDQYTIDLTPYAGQYVYVAIRHYNCSDEYMVYVDQYEVWGEYNEVPPTDEPLEVIDVVDVINFVEPVYGEHPFYNVSVPEDANYTIDYTDWNWYDVANDDGDILEEDEYFDNEGYAYYQYFEIVPNEGYTFDEDTGLTINGGFDLVDFCGVDELDDGSVVLWGYSIDFYVQEDVSETPEPTEVPPTTVPGEPTLIAGYYFEDESVDGWTFVNGANADNGTSWIWSGNNQGGYDYTEYAYEGIGFILSYSYVDYVGAYQADNWAVSPAVAIPEGNEASVRFYATNANASYPETLDVYIGTTNDVESMTLLQTITPSTGYNSSTENFDWTEYEIDLSAYTGETVYLAFHDTCYDMYEGWIDQVEFFGEGEPVVPTEVPPTEVPPTEVPPTDVPGLNDLDRALNVPGGSIHFESTGTYPWVTVEEGDRFYAKSSNEGVASTTSTVTTTVEAVAGDIVQFEFKAWGEGSYTFWDHCDFFVNGTQVFTYGAYDNDWEQFIYIFEADGTYTLTWTYTKDSSVNPTGDYFAVDNVYVGEPVHVEEIIATEDLTIPVNRTGVIEWTVLPVEAANKAVTFVSDDTSIATVNENGVVFGVAEGETFVTIASVEDPTIFAVCEITVIDTGLTMAQIYSICTYDFSGMYDDQWITYSDVAPSAVTSLATAPAAYAACYAFDTVFGYTTDGQFFTAPIDDIGNATYSATGFNATMTSMTFDYVTGLIYGMAADDYNSYFVSVDPATGAVTTIATVDNHLYGICADENGVIYGIANTGALYTVDTATGAQTLVGNTGVSCSYVQDICYDFNTGDIYWGQLLDADNASLYRIDKNTAAATECGPIGATGAEVVGMFIINNNEPGGDDVAVTGVTINPTEVTIRVGETAQFTASVQPFNATNKNVEWSVDDEDIIMVDQNGTVVGLAVGTAMVCVTTEDGGYNAFAIVNVIPPMGEQLAGYYFEAGNNADNFTFVDMDGDGHNWIWQPDMSITPYCTPYEGEGLIYSESYNNDTNTALTPDNWAISPAIVLPAAGGSVTLYACGQDADWALEHFMIYAGTSANPNDMVSVSEEFIATGEYVQYEADLSQFAGQTVYVAIRHFNVTDQFMLNIDAVEVWANEGGEPPVTHLWGDADGDGDVDSIDVLSLMRYVMNLMDLDAENLDPWCDVNGDGNLDMVDALLIARYVNGLIPELPCF